MVFAAGNLHRSLLLSNPARSACAATRLCRRRGAGAGSARCCAGRADCAEMAQRCSAVAPNSPASCWKARRCPRRFRLRHRLRRELRRHHPPDCPIARRLWPTSARAARPSKLLRRARRRDAAQSGTVARGRDFPAIRPRGSPARPGLASRSRPAHTRAPRRRIRDAGRARKADPSTAIGASTIEAGDVFPLRRATWRPPATGHDMTRKQDELVFAPLGGLGEIGMNATLYGFGPRAAQMDPGRLRPIFRRTGTAGHRPDLAGPRLHRRHTAGSARPHHHARA